MMMNNLGKQFQGFATAIQNNNKSNQLTHSYNQNAFCNEAKDRFNLQNTPHVFLRSTDITPYNVNNSLARYQTDPNHASGSFMTLSGDYYIMQDLGPSSEKNFCTTALYYEGKTPYEFYKWYETFSIHVK